MNAVALFEQVPLVASLVPVPASISDPGINTNFPGASSVAGWLGGLKFLALSGCLASLFIGGGYWGLATMNGNGSTLGTITGTVDSAGNLVAQRYTPHGVNRTAASNQLPFDFTFTGQTNDLGTGLIDYNARHYDPQLGRFTQADTVLDGLNRYTYVRNNPIRFNDPSGHCVESLSYDSSGRVTGFTAMRGAECWKGDQQGTAGSYPYQPGSGHNVRRDRYSPVAAGPIVGLSSRA